MKTLYVSDLDGTLLTSDVTTSEYTNRTINELVSRGMLFSYATARSYSTASKVAKGLNAKIPLIVYNGAFVIDNVTEEIMISNFFGPDIQAVLEELIAHSVYPIVYAFVDGVERFSYIRSKCGQGMLEYIDSRAGDRRDHPVEDEAALRAGEIFYITCIGEEAQLEPFYRKYRDQYHCVFQADVYTGEPWLEIMPMEASKSHATKQLKELLGCERLVVFGDGKNDIDMFELADEGYAVKNAMDELKRVATAVIGSNDEDGVARWLEAHALDDAE